MSFGDMISSNFVDKNNMKFNLSREDESIQYNLFNDEKLRIKVSQITIRLSDIADSFVPGHPENGKIYDEGKLIWLDDDLGGLVFDDPYINRLDGSMLFWDRDKHI
jgi:hypothetical protein